MFRASDKVEKLIPYILRIKFVIRMESQKINNLEVGVHLQKILRLGMDLP